MRYYSHLSYRGLSKDERQARFARKGPASGCSGNPRWSPWSQSSGTERQERSQMERRHSGPDDRPIGILVSVITSPGSVLPALCLSGREEVVHGEVGQIQRDQTTVISWSFLFLLGIGAVEVRRALGLARNEPHALQYDTSRMSPWVFGPYRPSPVTV